MVKERVEEALNFEELDAGTDAMRRFASMR